MRQLTCFLISSRFAICNLIEVWYGIKLESHKLTLLDWLSEMHFLKAVCLLMIELHGQNARGCSCCIAITFYITWHQIQIYVLLQKSINCNVCNIGENRTNVKQKYEFYSVKINNYDFVIINTQDTYLWFVQFKYLYFTPVIS